MSTTPDKTEAAEEAGLRIVSDSSLALLPKGAVPALEEMVSRSLAQIQINQTSGLSQRCGELVAPLKAGDEREFKIASGVKIVMCWIPLGDFLMGNHTDYGDEIRHRVKITRGFWLAKTPTTQSQWRAVMGNNPSHFKGSDLPVETVSWDDICGYESRTEGFLRKLNQFGSADGTFYLPTEAQWEYACRAGISDDYVGDLDEMGWYRDNARRETHPVGQKKPNAWGLHDMHGNVCEWCADRFGKYDVDAVEDPTGHPSGCYRVYRGGGWDSGAYHCRFAGRRNYGLPSNTFYDIGFRVARSSVSQR